MLIIVVWLVCVGVWWMPWQAVPMKDVWGCVKPRGVADRALIRGCPNEETYCSLWNSTMAVWLWGVRREVKHLSTCRKGYSVSSGERKRMRLNRVCVIPVGGCVCGVVGRLVLMPTRETVVRKLCVR